MNEIPCTIYDDGICGGEATQVIGGLFFGYPDLVCCQSHAQAWIATNFYELDTESTARLAAERQRAKEKP